MSLPNYPQDHKVGMKVPQGGSSCKKCEYVKGQTCKQKDFIQWKGDNIIPAPVNEYCCDFYEIGDKYKIEGVKFEDVGL